jgi:hypothetical protein
LAVLRVVGELYGVEGPDVGTEAAHWKFRGAIASMSENNVGLNGEDVLHFFLPNPVKTKGAWFPTPPGYF